MAKHPSLDAAKIAEATEECLAALIGGSPVDPFARVRHFIDELRQSPEWTDAEVIEVQTRIIRAIMKRISPPDPTQ